MEYKFYVKASPDGKSLGDCPFTHRANLAMKVKKVKATYILIDLSSKPKWFFSINPAGTVPVLDCGDKVIGDSYEIVRYLEDTYPSPPLDIPGNAEAEQATGQVFSIFSAWAKNKEEGQEAGLEVKFTQELEKIEQFLSKSSGPLLCGSSWSIADCALVPRLYHITAIARHYKGYSKFDSLPHLSRYMETAFSSEEFRATDYPREWVLQGWAKYFT